MAKDKEISKDIKCCVANLNELIRDAAANEVIVELCVLDISNYANIKPTPQIKAFITKEI